MANPAAANQQKWNRLQRAFAIVSPLVAARTDFSDASLDSVTSRMNALRAAVNYVAAVAALEPQLDEFFDGQFRALLDGFRNPVDGAPSTDSAGFANFVLYFSRVGRIIDDVSDHNWDAAKAFHDILRYTSLVMCDFYTDHRPAPAEIDWLWVHFPDLEDKLDEHYRKLEEGDSAPSSSSANQTLSIPDYNHNQDKSDDDDDDDDGADSGNYYVTGY